jgi:hypothetical protein
MTNSNIVRAAINPVISILVDECIGAHASEGPDPVSVAPVCSASQIHPCAPRPCLKLPSLAPTILFSGVFNASASRAALALRSASGC